jgi:uroporphyrinogen decarboxylase
VYTAMFVCGDATKNIDVICHTRPDSLFVDENIDIVAAKRITDSHNVLIGGNLPLTTVMLLGTQQDNMKYASDLIAKVGGRNFILAPGCDMPFDVPKDNVVGIAQAVRNAPMTKKMLEGYEKKDEEIAVDLPDYKNLKKPLVEVFTLDSDACAACGYMKAAVEEAQVHFGERIDSVEYKFTTKENIARVKKLGVMNLPTMLINGELAFSSLIPSRKELYEKIENYLKVKISCH